MLSQATALIPQVQIWHIDRLVFYARNPRKNDVVVDRMRGLRHLPPEGPSDRSSDYCAYRKIPNSYGQKSHAASLW